jgi:hypothetical protein
VTGAPVGYALRYADGSALRRRATANLGARGVNLGRRSGVRPSEWTASADCYDLLAGVLILKIDGAHIAESGV